MAAAAAVAALSFLAVSPQEVEDVTGAIDKYRGVLALANQKLEDLEVPEAVALFTEVIDGYKAGKLPSTTPLTRQIVGQAYEGRARAHANLGDNAKAEADYEELLRFDITWPVDRTRTSPKILALYDRARQRLVGTIAVQTDPSGAVVTLNGEAAGRTPLQDRELVAGPYTLRVEAPGFDPVTEQVVVQGGGRLERVIRLKPNARSVLVATSPPGAKVTVDGQERGTTFGAAGAEYAEIASRLGIPLADLSAPLLVEHLAPGNHLMRVEKECHEPQLLTIATATDPNDYTPIRFEPIRLAPSRGSLGVDSTPPGAEVLLDGKPAGATPLRLEDVCSGSHELVLRVPGAGQWRGRVDVVRGQRAAVSEKIRMTIAWAGMTAAGPGGEAPAGEKELGEILAGLKGFNVLGPGAGLPDTLIARRQKDGVLEEGRLSKSYLSALSKATDADLIIVARPGEGAFERRTELIIHAAREPFFPIHDRVDVSLDDPEQARGLVAKLETVTPLRAPWIGLEAIEIHRAPNPIVIRVHPGSPAARAGVKPGDAIVALGGKPIARPLDLKGVLAGLKEGAQASLTLQAPGSAPRQANIAVGSTPLMPRPGEPGRLTSLLIAEMSFRSRLEAAVGRPRSQERSTALLTLAMALMREGEYEAALTEALQKVEAAPGFGVSSGTASYLKGICLQKLNRLAEARQQLTQAAGQPDATLWDNSGPAVAERAKRLLGTLPPG